MELGGNIELLGFDELEISELIVLKKIIGNFARKFSDHLKDDYQKLSLHLKKVHGKKSHKYELKATLKSKKKSFTSEITEVNLFVCVADVLKKIEAQVMK